MKRFRLISQIFDVFSTAKQIREDEEVRSRSVKFAVSSIIYSLLMVACAAGGAFLLTLRDSGLLYIFIIVIALTLLSGAGIQFIAALLRVIMQITINRKFMTWVALAVFILSVAATAIAVIYILG